MVYTVSSLSHKAAGSRQKHLRRCFLLAYFARWLWQSLQRSRTVWLVWVAFFSGKLEKTQTNRPLSGNFIQQTSNESCLYNYLHCITDDRYCVNIYSYRQELFWPSNRSRLQFQDTTTCLMTGVINTVMYTSSPRRRPSAVEHKFWTIRPLLFVNPRPGQWHGQTDKIQPYSDPFKRWCITPLSCDGAFYCEILSLQ
jgi:hypothetical protein